MITVENLTKRYGQVTAVDSLSFAVPEHSLFAFLGTNGAGKSTTISCMTTLLGFDAGTIRIGSYTVGADNHQLRKRIGVVFQRSVLDPRLTVTENLRLRAQFYGAPRARVHKLARLIGLEEFQHKKYGVLSGGQQRRVDIARALIHQPQVLFLDEPTAGLDPQSREQVWQAIAELRNTLGLTVVLTTHYMDETEAADQAVLVDRGKVRATGTPMQLRTRYTTPELRMLLTPQQRDSAISMLEHQLHTDTWFEEGGAVVVPLQNSHQALAIVTGLGESVSDFQVVQGSMDDVFLRFAHERES